MIMLAKNDGVRSGSRRMCHGGVAEIFGLGAMAAGAFGCTDVFIPGAVTLCRPPAGSPKASCRGLRDHARFVALRKHPAAGKNAYCHQRHPPQDSSTNLPALQNGHQTYPSFLSRLRKKSKADPSSA